MHPVLKLFSPTVRRWFSEAIGEPTDIQRLAWPLIAEGRHVLVSAPTGSGKTLTAFLWALDRLLSGAWEPGGPRVLYISPLKALNNDIERNLLQPLAGLTAELERHGQLIPSLRVMTRSGDTPQNERQKMIRRPPEILITTPESLNLMLTSKGGRSILGGIESVILDEIHAVAGSKRGTHLITAVERLTLLSGEFQRISLSATARPLERVAEFVGGFHRPLARGSEPYEARPVEIVESTLSKRYELTVATAPNDPKRVGGLEAPVDEIGQQGSSDDVWEALCSAFCERIRRNRSTLLFANSRRATEKVTRFINREAGRELAYSHHGSLSREIRSVVEQRLKDGELAAIVATNSLELGIDIGALDEVILIQTPPTIASAVQRLGRAGHQVGATSRGQLFPLFDRDFIEAAVVSESVLGGHIEQIHPILKPLDVLAQVILSMVCAETWQVDELFAFLRTTYPYHSLKRSGFDLVIEMLSGRYSATRVRELEPRLSFDRIDQALTARPGTARRIYMAGGTIPDRGYFQLRTFDTRAKIGELDEEFVWERSLGDSFTLGAQSWRIRQVTHNDVLVAPSGDTGAMAPFWRAEERDRSFFLSVRLGEFLERAEACLQDSKKGQELLKHTLRSVHQLTGPACDRLLDLLDRQRAATRGLPHRHHLLVEHVADPSAKNGETRAILHTLWGGRVNRPYAMALATAWQDATATPLQVEADNDCVAVTLPHRVRISEVMDLVHPDTLESLLRRSLEGTGFFGARFRENAGRALLLPRSDFKQRVPLWLTRERSKKLLEAVRGFDDFPIVAETWRTCLQDAFDLSNLKSVLHELADGDIRLSEVRVALASPFSEGIVWRTTNRLMYEDDTPEGSAASRLRPDLLEELAASSSLRPKLPQELIQTLSSKLQRTYPGYAPRSADELLEWTKERLIISKSEWLSLLASIERDQAIEIDQGTESDPTTLTPDETPAESLSLARLRVEQWLHELSVKLLAVQVEATCFVCARESFEALASVLLSDLSAHGSASDAAKWCQDLLPFEAELPSTNDSASEGGNQLALWLSSWLRFYGPISRSELLERLPVSEQRLDAAIEELAQSSQVIVDHFRQEDERIEVCDRENLERLLRLLRSSRRVSLPSRPLTQLPLFLATHLGLVSPGSSIEDLQFSLERLLGYSAPVESWEDDLLPARLDPYFPAWLDSLLQDTDLSWLGAGERRLMFAFPEDRDLVVRLPAKAPGQDTDSALEPRSDPSREEDPQIEPPSALPEALKALAYRSFEAPKQLSLEELNQASELSSSLGALQDQLWDAAWLGQTSNSTFAAVRRGILQNFKAARASAEPGGLASRRSGRPTVRRGAQRWKRTQTAPGSWFAWPNATADEQLDPLEREERNKDRARLLLERYGVVFRELLAKESNALSWSPIFRALRMMELSGEVTSGLFFDGIAGLQFTSTEGLKRLREGLNEDAVYWMSALDPAAPSGLGLRQLGSYVPSRLRSNHLVYQGSEPVVISRRNGSDLQILVNEDHPSLDQYLQFLKSLVLRPSRTSHFVDVQVINDLPAYQSPYRVALSRLFEVTRTSKGLRLRKRFQAKS